MKNKNSKFLLFLFLFLLLVGSFGFGKSVLAAESVIINEIMYSPKGTDANHEWLEIFNLSSELINLSGWILFESTAKHGLKLYQGDLDLAPGEYAIIADDAGTFKNDHPEYTDTIIDSVFSLSNTGESFSIKNGAGEIISEILYNSAIGADGNGFSIERDELGSLRESYSLGGTPGRKNSEKPEPKSYSDKIVINELLPAPSSGNEEFIELYNPTSEDIDLSGYLLKDASKTGKYVFSDGAQIESSAYLVIYKKDYKFALNNSGVESVTFFDPSEKIVSAVSYSGSKTDISYNFAGGAWRWSKFLTPGKANKFNNLPEVSRKKDSKIYANVYADFSAKGHDKDRDKLKFTWDFGDGHKSYKKETRHKYKKSGKYKVTLKVSDGSEDKIETFNIKVEKFPKNKVRILSVSPNPAGKDSDNEYIVLQNKSKKKINLKDWSVATGSKNLYNHPISEDIVIKPGETLKLTRQLSTFVLNNKKSKIELRYPDGKVASQLAYDKKKESIKEDEIYTRESGQWAWVASKTETALALETKPLETVTPLAIESETTKESGVILASGKNFSEDENLQKIALVNFTKPQGIVLGAATFEPNLSEAYQDQNKNSYLEIVFASLNSFMNHFLNKIFLKLTL